MAKRWTGDQSEGKSQRGFVLPSADLIRTWLEEISVCEVTGIEDDGTELLSKIVETLGSELTEEDRNVILHAICKERVKDQYQQIFDDATRKLVDGLIALSKEIPCDQTHFKLMGAIGDNIVVAVPIRSVSVSDYVRDNLKKVTLEAPDRPLTAPPTKDGFGTL